MEYKSIGDSNQTVDKYGLTAARMALAQDDEEVFEVQVVKIKDNTISMSNGFHLGVPVALAAEEFQLPAPATLYGKGIGYAVRGLKIAGVLIHYKTATEYRQELMDQLYGKDVAEYLARWDAGSTVVSISMGGFGPSYEQALQTLMVEMLRKLHVRWPEPGEIDFEHPLDQQQFQTICNEVVDVLDKQPWGGFSGAMVNAARHLAAHFISRGVQEVLLDEHVKQRLININNMHNYKPAA